MPLWKRLLLRSVGFGAGFAITLCGLVAVWIWYSGRPTPPGPWNKTAITAEYDGVSTTGDKNELSFHYTLQNNTDADFRVDSDSGIEITATLRAQKGFVEFSRKAITVDFPIFVPAKSRVRLPLNLRYPYPVRENENAAAEERKQYRADIAKYVTNRWSNLGGFVVFDKTNRYEIDFPSGWENGAMSGADRK